MTRPKNKRQNPNKKRRNPAADFDILDLLGILFRSIHNEVPNYPHVEQQRAKDFFKETDKMWQKIMMLCHPDRHNNSELSTEVTRWLIDNRPKKR